MGVDVARELVEAGLAAEEREVEELHRTEGPAVLTACCRARETLVWVEHEHRAADRVVEQRQVIASLAPLLRTAGLAGIAATPTITQRATALYPGLPGSSLLVDALLPTGPIGIDRDRLLATCRHLGTCLARLHSVPRADVPGRLLRGSEAVRTVAGLVERRLGVVPATLGLEAVQELLACERQEVAATLASACARFEHCADSVVLHGRYCPGFVVAGSRGDPEDVRVIGWTAAAFGPAEFDVGWFVGELEELAAAREAGDLPGARVLRSAAAAFVSAYLARRGGRGSEAFRRDCGSYAAVKVVAHLAEFARYFTLDRGAADLQLSLAERLTDPAWAARILAEEAQ